MKKNTVYDVLYSAKLWVHPDSRFQFINTDVSARLVMELIDKGVSNQVLNLTATGIISVKEIMQLAGRSVNHDQNTKPVYYELSTEKVSHYLSLPNTYDTVREFLDEGQS
jgi:dTDP-4-dehydrorhamnose reductase